jgi:hypothetical protein
MPVARLHRFSELRAVGEDKLAHSFPTVDARLRVKVCAYVLDRLPPNLRYSRTNADHIADRSVVTGQKAILLRGGAVLVRKGQVVDTRIEDALRAALDAQPGRKGAVLAALGLVLIVTLLAGQAMAASSPRLARPFAQLIVLLAFAAVLSAGKIVLALTALSEMAIPMAVVAAMVAHVSGARAGAVVALLGAAYAALGLAFDATTFAVTLGGGLALALVVRRGQRLRFALVGAAASGVVQGFVFGACVLMGARPRSIDSVFAGAQAVLSGFAAGGAGFGAALGWELLKARVSRGRAPGPEISPAQDGTESVVSAP